MEIDFDTCYRAVQSRDSRFDGRFFTAVTSTGIYCRPICPAQTPQQRNVRFYPSAAAAQAAGFRACRRCRPESAPGSPDWNVRSDLVGRALRLIAEGTADTERVSGLAQRLAVSPRHLHRELIAEVGAGPLALARTRRAQTARLLIDQTDMPLGEVAFAAGFSSIRQFNDSMRAAFGCNPSELRRRGAAPLPGRGAITLHLPYRPPLDAESLISFFAQRAVAGVEEVVDGRYRRTLRLGRTHGLIEIEFAASAPEVIVRLQLEDVRDLGLVVARCRQMLDLEMDPLAVRAVLETDPLLAPLVARRPGLRIPGAVDGWEAAVKAVLGQQISVAGARTLTGRLVAAFGTPLPEPDGSLTHLFPSPEAIAEADLSGLGITGTRIRTLQALARAVAGGEIILDRGADRDETAARLLELPGIGLWTAAYISMRALGDPDAFPATDLGLRRALERLGLDLTAKALAEHARAWQPWRAYAVIHLWSSLADEAPTIP